MTRRRIYAALIAVLLVVALGVWLNRMSHQDDGDVAYYTCSMHPQIHADEPGNCPICGMKLVPVKKMPPSPSTSAPGVQIDPAYTQRIGVVSEPVTVRPLEKTVHAAAKVAHDPALWIAETEFLQALILGDSSLIKAAELKLQFMGLSPAWIAELKKGRIATSSLHVPAGHAEYVEAYLYPSEVEAVTTGYKVDVLDVSGQTIKTGIVASVSTVLDMDTRTIRVLVKTDGGIPLRPNTFVQAVIRIPQGEALAVPETALLFNGDHTMAYVVTADGRYVPRAVVLGNKGNGYYAVRSGLSEGERVVVNGSFLIDAETQIRTGGMAEHQH